MGNTVDYIEVKSYGDILPKKGTNSRTPYEHQKMAMQALDKMNQETAFSTLVVIPTGGGKTYTASMWLLKNAIDKKKKNRLKKIENDISDFEEKISAKEEELHSDEVMNDYQKYNEITAELEGLNNQLEELMIEWEELSEEMNA